MKIVTSSGFVLILIIFEISPSQCLDISIFQNISSEVTSWSKYARLWLWGPDGIITIHALNTTKHKNSTNQSIFDNYVNWVTPSQPVVITELAVDVKPLWTQGIYNFPLLGLDGVLVKSEPFDGCNRIHSPPKEPTPIEFEITELEENTTHVQQIPWFLIVDDNGCEITTKIKYAAEAGYSVVILLIESNTTVDLNKTFSFDIFPCAIDYDDGTYLANNYVYPEPFIAKLQDSRSLQWSNAVYKIIGITVVVLVIVVGFLVCVVKCVKKFKKKAEVKAAETERDNILKVLEKLPVTVWELNQLTKDEKCRICFGLFHQNDIIRTLPCYHRFHQRCVLFRFDNGHTDCAVCNYQIIVTDRRKSTETTPLL